MTAVAESLPREPSLLEHPAVSQRAAASLEQHQQTVFCRTDRLFAGLLLFQWLVGAVLHIRASGLWLRHAVLSTWHPAAGPLLAAALLLLPACLALVRPGRPWTRHLLAASQIAFSALLIHLTSGHAESVFHVFGVLAFLALYRDWRVLATASGIAVFLAPLGALSADSFPLNAWDRFGQVGAILAEDLLLFLYCRQSLKEMRWGAERQALSATVDALVERTLAKRQWSEEALRAAHDRLHQAHEELDTHVRRRTEELGRANEALQRNLSILKAQQEASLDGILVVDEAGRVCAHNRRFCELWKVPEALPEAGGEQLLRDHLLSEVTEPEAFLAVAERCAADPSLHSHDEVVLCDGRIFERDTRPVVSDTGQNFGRVWYFRDVTDRRRAEAQILRLNRELSHAYEAVTEAYDATITGWSRALDLRDQETEGHSQRVTDLTLRLAVAMGICGDDLLHLRRGALLHDIGKMGVPDSILLKTGPLTPDEWAIMRRHPAHAYEMLSPIAFLRPALDIPYCHHEKWDGSGYPRGLKGEDIPLAARLFAVVDVWDALRSDRPYRPGWSESQVKGHIAGLSGTHFDPQVVEVFLAIVSEQDRVLPDVELFSEMNLFGEGIRVSSAEPARERGLEELPWAA